MNLDKSIEYFKWLTDEQGIIQFSKGYEKDREYGYAIEDQARALILSLRLEDAEATKHFLEVVRRAVSPEGVKMLWNEKGEFKNNTDRGGEATAEVVWALGEYQKQTGEKTPELEILTPEILNSKYPRVWMYGILGLVQSGDMPNTRLLASKLGARYRDYAKEDWRWVEETMTYANALLPWCMIEAFEKTGNPDFRRMAEETMGFLYRNLQRDGKPVLVGFNGWWKRGELMAMYGQQPIDAAYLVLAALKMYEILGNESYKQMAEFYFSWFSGNNIKETSLIREDGACFDGLGEGGVNPNAGAESNICYLMAALEMKKLTSSYFEPGVRG